MQAKLFEDFKKFFGELTQTAVNLEKQPVLLHDPITREIINEIFKQKSLEPLYSNEQILRYYVMKYGSTDVGKFFLSVLDDLYRRFLITTTYTDIIKISGILLDEYRLFNMSLPELAFIQYNLSRLYLSIYTVLHKYLYEAETSKIVETVINIIEKTFDTSTLHQLVGTYNLAFVIDTQVNAAATIAFQKANLLQKVKILGQWIENAEIVPAKKPELPPHYRYRLRIGTIEQNSEKKSIILIPVIHKVFPIDATLVKLINYGLPAIEAKDRQNAEKHFTKFINMLENIHEDKHKIKGKAVTKERIKELLSEAIKRTYEKYQLAKTLIQNPDALKL